MEDPCPSSCSSYLDHYPVNFLELLNMQDFGPSVFDVLPPTIDQNSVVQESSEVLNAPPTPNYSSISSESSGGQNDSEEKLTVDDGEEEEENEKTKKQLKTKKTNEKKRQREPRFAFMTKSEVDHLEDGYRWRKYGQKAVKHSPFPRSYYKCTFASCNVKKRVERSCDDPTIVVTTYEGQHTHPSPVIQPRSAAAMSLLPPYSGGGGGAAPSGRPQQQFSYSFVPNGFVGSQSSATLLTDEGLLQDIVPWSVIKKEKQ